MNALPALEAFDDGPIFLVTDDEMAQEVRADNVYFVSPAEYRLVVLKIADGLNDDGLEALTDEGEIQ